MALAECHHTKTSSRCFATGANKKHQTHKEGMMKMFVIKDTPDNWPVWPVALGFIVAYLVVAAIDGGNLQWPVSLIGRVLCAISGVPYVAH